MVMSLNPWVRNAKGMNWLIHMLGDIYLSTQALMFLDAPPASMIC